MTTFSLVHEISILLRKSEFSMTSMISFEKRSCAGDLKRILITCDTIPEEEDSTSFDSSTSKGEMQGTFYYLPLHCSTRSNSFPVNAVISTVSPNKIDKKYSTQVYRKNKRVKLKKRSLKDSRYTFLQICQKCP